MAKKKTTKKTATRKTTAKRGRPAKKKTAKRGRGAAGSNPTADAIDKKIKDSLDIGVAVSDDKRFVRLNFDYGAHCVITHVLPAGMATYLASAIAEMLSPDSCLVAEGAACSQCGDPITGCAGCERCE